MRKISTTVSEGLPGSVNIMPTISLLILTYNSQPYLSRLFASLKSVIGNEIGKGIIEIIIVDNASTDDTETEAKKLITDHIYFYQNRKNAGYAKGINDAAQKAKGKILVVINPDARLVEADFKSIIEEFDQNKKMAIAGMTIENEHGVRENTAGNFYNPITFFLFSLGLEKLAGLRFSPHKKKKVDYVSGGFVAFRKEYFDELDGYDEDYFMYVEDMDICYRAKMMGYSTYFLPYAKLIHKGQGSSSREFAIVNIYKGLSMYYEKHASFLNQQYVKNLLSIKAATIIFLGSMLNKKELVSTYSKALKTIS